MGCKNTNCSKRKRCKRLAYKRGKKSGVLLDNKKYLLGLHLIYKPYRRK